MRMRDLPEGRTKLALNSNKIKEFNQSFGALLQGKLLSIICADDVYYNLETLRIVFQRLRLIEYCHFVATG